MRGKLDALCRDGSKLDNVSYKILLKLFNRFKRCSGDIDRRTERKHNKVVNTYIYIYVFSFTRQCIVLISNIETRL